MERKLKAIVMVAPNGSKAINPGRDVIPATTDMVVYSYDGGILQIDAPVVGELSTDAQRKAVNELIADWLGKRKMKISAAKGDFDIKRDVRTEDGYQIPYLSITAPDGRPTPEQLSTVCNKAIEWLNATGKKPTPAKPDDSGKKPADSGKKPDDSGKKPAVGPDEWDPDLSIDENLDRIMGKA